MGELAWVTQSQVASLGLIKSATVTLTDAQIKALPTTPVVVIPPTEILNYSGFPNSMPVIVTATASLDATAGAYTNISGDGISFLALVYGSAYDLNAASICKISVGASSPELSFIPLDNQAGESFYQFSTSIDPIDTGSLGDNAIAISARNTGGDFTGGNSENTLKVTVYYAVVDV